MLGSRHQPAIKVFISGHCFALYFFAIEFGLLYGLSQALICFVMAHAQWPRGSSLGSEAVPEPRAFLQCYMPRIFSSFL